MRERGDNLSEENALCKLKCLSCPFFLFTPCLNYTFILHCCPKPNLVLECTPTQRHSTLT